MIHDTNHRLVECFQRGLHLSQIEKNYDYAHAMFSECLTHDAGKLSFAEALIANLKAKFGNDKKAARHFLRLPGEHELKKAVAAKKWTDVLRLGLDLLKSDPWHVTTLHSMAQACQELHFNEVELVYLKQALESAPKDIEVNRHCARSLARMGQFDQAIACWHRIEEITGGNAEAAKMISQLAEDKIHFASNTKDIEARKRQSSNVPANTEEQQEENHTAAGDHDAAPEALSFGPQQRLERAIATDPADVSNYLKLAELLCESGYHEKALDLLARAERNCAQTALVHEAQDRILRLRQQAVAEAAEIERKKRLKAEGKGFRVPWLELVLCAAGALLVFQIFPSWWQIVWSRVVDHARISLFLLNIAMLALLILWRQWKR